MRFHESCEEFANENDIRNEEIAYAFFNDECRDIAKLLKISFVGIDCDVHRFEKTTGGKINALKTASGFSVFGVEFAGDSDVDSLFWALQWAVHCR